MSSLPLYRIVVFLHVASAVGLFAVLAVEGVSLRGLAKSATYEQAREWAGLVDLLLPLGLPATLVILASGIYLATTAGFWELGWVKPAVPTYVLVVITGAIVGPRRNRLRAALAEGMGSLPDELRAQAMDPRFRASWRCRAALLCGLLYVMSVRPESALPPLVLFGLAGLVWSIVAWKTRPHRP